MKLYFTIFVFALVNLPSFGQDTTRLSLLFVGDIMGHDTQITSAYNPVSHAYEYDSCFHFVKPIIDSADIAIGNLELTLSGLPYRGYPAFSSPDSLAASLKNSGFDVLVTANNHSCDRGKKGIERTIETLDNLHIDHTGTFVDEASRLNDYPFLIEKNGIRLALLNYTYGTNGIPIPSPTFVNLIDTLQMAKDIAKAKSDSVEVIIAFLHWGAEYQNLPNAFQKKITDFLFRNDVSIIIGSHPHVIQPMRFDKGKNQVVAYSLGNFVSGQRPRYRNGGAMLRVELKKVKGHDRVDLTIDKVSYSLVYVHVDSQKDYFILPISVVENEEAKFFKDAPSRKMFELFVEDSRALLNQYNVNVEELKSIIKE
jgi:poly-gamma-glutamate capsule biosynthesis protein CapA/YwtB (metallophosphatase superfamily)